MRPAPVLLVLVGALLSACGTTVASVDQARVSGQPGLVEPAVGAPGGQPPTSAPTAVTPGAVAPGSVPPPVGAGVPLTGPDDGPPTGSATATVSVGIVYDEGTDSFAKQFGLGFLSTGDGRAQGQAFVDLLNGTGGIAGRRVVPVFAPMHTAEASSSGADQAQASVCAALTQDHRVTLAIGNLAPQASFLACLHRAGVPYVTNAASLDSTTARGVAPHFYLPGGWLMDRLLEVELTRLVQTGFLSRSTKVGLMYYDTPDRARVAERVVKPLLRKAGIPLVAEGSVAPTPEGNSRFAGLVLSFRTAGVDRVVEVSTSPLLFMQAAEAQGYRPRYVVDSVYGPGAALQGNAPKAQLEGAQGIGWEPLSDTDGAHRPASSTSSERTCTDVLRRTGQTSSSAVTTLYQLRFCDGFLFVQRALRTTRGELSGQVLAAAVRALGTGYVPAATFATDFGQGRPDGAIGYRDLRYDTGCGCFVYVGGVRSAGR